MPKNKYYHFDHETYTFVEVQSTSSWLSRHLAGMVVGVLVVASVLAWSFDHFLSTPEELALKAENEELQAQLERTSERIATMSTELEKLSEKDQDLYRVLLQADPISDDVRQAGVGGTDPYASFNRFSYSTAQLLRDASTQLDQLERQMRLQNVSYRELTQMAQQHEAWLDEVPAIMPVDGDVISGFGMRLHPILKVVRMHPGIDIPISTGTPVYATGDGVVVEAGRNSGGYGINVVIEHRQAGYQTLYAHLSRIGNNIRPGMVVKRGQQIAWSGNTGLSKAPHLHYEVRDPAGNQLNPTHFLVSSMTPQQYKRLLEATEKSTLSLD